MRRVGSPAQLADRFLAPMLIAALVAIVVLLPVHAFISTWGGTEVGPLLVWKSWKELLLLGLVPVVGLYCGLRPDVARLAWKSWLIKLAFLYMLLHALFAITSSASSQAVIAGLLMNLRFLAIFALAAVVFYAGHPWVARIKQWLPTWLFVTTIVLSVLAIAQVTVLPRDFLVQFGYSTDTIPPYTLVDNNPEALRAFATMRGPNPLGAYLLLPLALAVVTVAKQRRNWLAYAAFGLGCIALGLTSSRSAWLGAGAAAVTLCLALVPRHKLWIAIKWGALPALALAAFALWIAMTVPAVRLAVFHSSPTDASLVEGSSQKHWQEVTRGVQDVASHPLGRGVGTAGPASFYNLYDVPKIPENYFVQLAQEVGVVGLLFFVAINVLVVYHLWRLRAGAVPKALLASFVGLTIINLFLHGWSDDPTAMTWWGIAGLYLFADNKD